MKKIIYLSFVAILIMAACSNNENFELADKQDLVKEENFLRDYDDVLTIARNAVLGRMKTRSTSELKVKSCDLYVHRLTTKTRAGSKDEARFYIVNFDHNCGFAIISADKRTRPVYAFSAEGNILLQNIEKNPGLTDFFDEAVVNYLNDVESIDLSYLNRYDPVPDTIADRDTFINGIHYYVATWSSQRSWSCLLSTEWAQGDPYNYYCPIVSSGFGTTGKALAGCVPVAISQIMAYHQYPASYSNTTFNWSSITSSPYYTGYTNASLATAELIHLIGEHVNAQYGYSETWAYDTDAVNTLQAWGYSTSALSDYNIQNIQSSIYNSRPVYTRGSASSNSGGHTWVIDAYITYFTQNDIYYDPYGINLYFSEITSESNYFHCNWGMGPYWGNGYYLSFNPNGNSFTQNKKIIYDIHPNN